MTRGKTKRRRIAKAWRRAHPWSSVDFASREFWEAMHRALPEMRDAGNALLESLPPHPPVTGKFIYHAVPFGRTWIEVRP